MAESESQEIDSSADGSRDDAGVSVQHAAVARHRDPYKLFSVEITKATTHPEYGNLAVGDVIEVERQYMEVWEDEGKADLTAKDVTRQRTEHQEGMRCLDCGSTRIAVK